MKVVVAIDSFKGSLSSIEAGQAVKAGVLAAHPDANVIIKPLADGGLGGQRIDLTVTGPMGSPVSCYYGYLEKDKTAIIEMASPSGITLVPAHQKNPLTASTRGVGEMIIHALEKGCRHFIIGIGGSATNDAGIGMLKALGYSFLDEQGLNVGEGAQALGKVASIDAKNRHPLLDDCQFRIACDVTKPLCGENGATYIYGPQKGVTEAQKESLDQDMAHFADVTETTLNCAYKNYPGAGAAGGLGFAFLSYLHASLSPGVELILDAINLSDALNGADIVVTGEGQLDRQTAMGKAPVGVAKLAKAHGAKVLAFSGSVTKEAVACNQAGIDAFFPILRRIVTLEEAMDPSTARSNMTASVEQVFRLL